MYWLILLASITLALYVLLLLWSTWQCLSENKGPEFVTDAEQQGTGKVIKTNKLDGFQRQLP
ncbi:MAG: hypothetical protein ACPGGF_05005 [Flavobacteriaceae bacterium]